MGLKDLVEDELEDPLECPICEEKGEETKYWYNRCTNPNCKITTWIHTEFSHDFDL